MRLNSKQIQEMTGGTFLVDPIDPTALATGLQWDSRAVEPGDVFVALPGEKVDGHRFIADALHAGAIIVLVSERPDAQTSLLASELGAALIEVSNTAAAVTDIARAWRKMLKAQVIAVTGSCGKTTTKNLLHDVFATKYAVVSTQGNQNNVLGVPKTLLQADPETQVIIVEMGMDRKGEIEQYCEFTLPDIGVITNIGQSHIELLGSRDAIAQAKAELFCALPERRGRAFMNRSDEYAKEIFVLGDIEKRDIELIYYDGSYDAEAVHAADQRRPDAIEDGAFLKQWGAWAGDITLDAQGCPRFVLHGGNETRECTLALRGVHNVANACAVASVALSCGIDLDSIAQALAHSVPETGRQELVFSREGLTVINDTYNANPDSMKAALKVLSSFETTGKRIAVLGDMGELGSFAQSCHEGVGEFLGELPLDLLICVGDLSWFIADAAEASGFSSDRVVRVKEISEVLVELEKYVSPEDVVLVKASRFMELERVVGGLVN